MWLYGAQSVPSRGSSQCTHRFSCGSVEWEKGVRKIRRGERGRSPSALWARKDLDSESWGVKEGFLYGNIVMFYGSYPLSLETSIRSFWVSVFLVCFFWVFFCSLKSVSWEWYFPLGYFFFALFFKTSDFLQRSSLSLLSFKNEGLRGKKTEEGLELPWRNVDRELAQPGHYLIQNRRLRRDLFWSSTLHTGYPQLFHCWLTTLLIFSPHELSTCLPAIQVWGRGLGEEGVRASDFSPALL